ncbi:MAG: hypothetical protein RID53_26095 [Coleofasciculus sp. B1-GNL1-01]|uniref:hypothetical protein n=1 Tax=Coleofasciculus sp. B1-GNL1-01 TaxID=3068484 RepID=UPI0032F27DD7
MQRSRIHLPLLYPIITATLLTLATGCSQVEPPPPTAQPNTPATPIPASPTSVSSPAASPEPDPFSQALDTAMSAATITQSAVSPDDWNLVVNRWQEAIALLEKTPSSHPKKQLASQKIDEYQRNLAYAKQQSVKSSQPKPSPKIIVASQPSATTSSSQPETQSPQPPATTPPSQPETQSPQPPATTPSSQPQAQSPQPPATTPSSQPQTQSPQPSQSPAISANVALAQHLQQSGAKMYEAYWCSVCRWQEKQFGPEAYAYVATIECDPRGKNAQPELCRQAKIQAFPTWEINGQFYRGGMQLEQLANLSGYSGSHDFN